MKIGHIVGIAFTVIFVTSVVLFLGSFTAFADAHPDLGVVIGLLGYGSATALVGYGAFSRRVQVEF